MNASESEEPLKISPRGYTQLAGSTASEDTGWSEGKAVSDEGGWKSVVRQKDNQIHLLEVELIELADNMQTTEHTQTERLYKQLEIKELKASKLEELVRVKDVKLNNINRKLNATAEKLSVSNEKITKKRETIAELTQENAVLNQKQKEYRRLFENTSRRAQELHAIVLGRDIEAITAPLLKEITDLQAQSQSQVQSLHRTEFQMEELWGRLESSDDLVIKAELRLKEFAERVKVLEQARASETSGVDGQLGSSDFQGGHADPDVEKEQQSDQHILLPMETRELDAVAERSMLSLSEVSHMHKFPLEQSMAELRRSTGAESEVSSENRQLHGELQALQNQMNIVKRKEVTIRSHVLSRNVSMGEPDDIPAESSMVEIEDHLVKKLIDDKEEWRRKLVDKEAELVSCGVRLQSWKAEALAAERRVRSLGDVIRVLKLRDAPHNTRSSNLSEEMNFSAWRNADPSPINWRGSPPHPRTPSKLGNEPRRSKPSKMN